MSQIIIVYDSRSGNTEKVASLVIEGARQVNGVQCTLKRIDYTTLDDLLNADGIIIGSPTYYGLMSGKIKELLDKSVEIHTKLEGKVGAAFTTSGGTATGAETTNLSIIEALLVHGMIVQGNPHNHHYGLAIVGEPKDKDKAICREFGKRIANLVVKVFKDN